MNYTKFSDEDLFESYQTTLDYSGKLENNLLLEIESRGGLDELKRSLMIKEKFSMEVKRIYLVVAHLIRSGTPLETIQSEITSNEIPAEDLTKLVTKQFYIIEAHQKDVSINAGTIVRTLIGMLISSAICTCLWFYSVFYSGVMYYILIPGFAIISYGIIKLLTRKSSRNVVVYLGTFFSVLIALVIGTALLRN